MTCAVRRINSRTGPGSDAPPALCACRPWPASSWHMASTMARLRRSSARQPVEMALEMAFDLALGLRDEPQTGLVAEHCGERADAERSGIPERIQHAGPGAELLEPGLAPGEVIGLLARRMEHEFADFGVAGEQGLGVIQGLGGDLAGMIHPHQGRGFAAVLGGQGGIGLGVRRFPGCGPAAGRPAAGGASRARRARSAAEIKVSRFGPRAMGRDYRA